MDFDFSLDWIFMVLTLASVVFLLQIMLDYNRQASVMSLQLRHANQILTRHAEEMEKIEGLMEEARKEAGELDEPLATLKARNDELDLKLKALEEQSEEEE